MFLKKIRLRKIGEALKSLFGRQYKLFKENSELAVKITNTLKDALNNPLVDILTAIIPGDLDDKIKKKAREVVDRAAKEIAVAHKLVQASASNQEAWAGLIKHLQTIVPEGRTAFWVQFSGKVNEFLADGKIDFNEGVILTQMLFKEKKLIDGK